MFGLFNDPFSDYGYAPRRVVRAYDPFFGYYYKPVRRNYDPFGINSLGAYMHAMDQAFNQIFGYYNDEEEQEPEKNEAPKKDDIKEEKKDEVKEEKKEETPKKEEKKETKVEKKVPTQKIEPQYWSRSSVFSSHSRGGIEEIREKTYDSKTGETVESQTRRIGDRWCRIDTTTDKDGVSKSKETWHNVADDEMEHFKKEWVSRRGLNSKATKAIEDKKDEAKTEEKKENKEEKPETQ